MIAGGVESMSRAPFVMPKAESAFSRANAVYDTTIGWRFVNQLMKEQYGVDSMPETAENVAADFKIEREAQDRMALRIAAEAPWRRRRRGFFDAEIVPVTIAAEEGRADRRRARTSIRARPASRRSPSSRASCGPTARVTAGNASRRERRRLRAAAGQRGAAAQARPDAARARRRHGHRRRARRASWASARRRRRSKVLELTGLDARRRST